MGGLGSGRYLRSGKKAKTGECLAFDIRHWKRLGWLDQRRIEFRDGAVVLVKPDAVSYYYSGASHWDGRSQIVHEQINLIHRACHLGGKRPMFVCPRCTSSVFVLYKTGYFYRCRRCANLAFASQSETKLDREMGHVNRLLRRLHPLGCFMHPILVKPPRMRQRTYQEIVAEVERLKSEIFPAWVTHNIALVKQAAVLIDDPKIRELTAAIESGNYLDFEFPEIDLDAFDFDTEV
jgi:hypothetical protein